MKVTPMDHLATLIGLIAPVLFLYAYAMVSTGRWQAEQFRFHLLNFIGAVFILISLTQQWNLAVCILEGFWGAISLYGMAKAWRHRPAHIR